jgi:hypothetical protein
MAADMVANGGWRRLAEVPTMRPDRSAGQINFKLRKWSPHHLHWYFAAFRGRISRILSGHS